MATPLSFIDASIELFSKATDATIATVLPDLLGKGLLDLATASSKGQTVLDALLDQGPLGPLTVQAVIDGRQGGALHRAAAPNKPRPIDRQLAFVSQAKGPEIGKRAAQGLAVMLRDAPSTYWEARDLPGDDPGARLSKELCEAPEGAGLEAWRALLARGVKPDARVGASCRTLACANITALFALKIYQAAGGNILAPVWETDEGKQGWPLWQHLAFAHGDERVFLKDLERVGTLKKEDLDMVEHWHHLAGKGSFSHTFAGQDEANDWRLARLSSGEPWWMLGLSQSPSIARGIYPGNRFVERDERGRSGWFWLYQAAKGVCAPDVQVLEAIQPRRQYALDTQGRGLVVQLIEHDHEQLDGAQQGWSKRVGAQGDIYAWARWTGFETIDPKLAYAGLETQDFGLVFERAKTVGMVALNAQMLLKEIPILDHAQPKQRGHLLAAALWGLVSLNKTDILKSTLDTLDLGGKRSGLEITWPRMSPEAFDALGKVIGESTWLGDVPAQLLAQWQTDSQAQELAEVSPFRLPGLRRLRL